MSNPIDTTLGRIVEIHNKASELISENSPIPVPKVEIPDPSHPFARAAQWLQEVTSSPLSSADQDAGLIVSSSATVIAGTSAVTASVAAWCRNHKLALSVVAAGTTVAFGYILYSSFSPKAQAKKRKARKAANGARQEVVILAAPPSAPLTRLIAQDLDRRGFIIYITSESSESDSIIAQEESQDIRALHISPQSSSETRSQLLKFAQFFEDPNIINTSHQLFLTGVIIIPDLNYPTGPIENLGLEAWSDAIYSKLLTPLALISNGLLELVRTYKSRIIVLTPSIMGDLQPPFHSIETVISSSLSNLSLILHRELSPNNVPVVNIKMGSFDLATDSKRAKSRYAAAVRQDISVWPKELQRVYGSSYQASATSILASSSSSTVSNGGSKIKPSALRDLHHAIFNSLESKNPQRVIGVGRGSKSYGIINKILPIWCLDYMLSPSSDATYEGF